MKTIKVHFADGNSLITSINGSETEIERYYVGQQFNIGVIEDDMQTAIRVEYLDWIWLFDFLI